MKNACRFSVIAIAVLTTASSALGASTADWDTTQPRGKTREIRFTATEGTEMSVDVSADGRWVVYDLLGHIYRVPIAGGEAECLTQNSGIALNYHPRYSPDGRSIAFVSDRGGQNNLWVMNADGSNPRAVFVDLNSQIIEPAWAADGRSIVAVRLYPNTFETMSRVRHIWQFPLDGSEPRKLVGSNTALVYSPTLTADGRHLFYQSSSTPIIAEGYFKVATGHQIRRLDLATGRDDAMNSTGVRRPYHYEPVYEFAPAISPDGRWLAYARRVPGGNYPYHDTVYQKQTGLWVRDLESGRERLLIERMDPDLLESSLMYQLRLLPGYSWSRDGKFLVYSAQGRLWKVTLADGSRQEIPFRAPVHRVITEQVRPHLRLPDAEFTVRFPRWPSWSPDGRSVAFDAAGLIWLKTLPDGAPRRLTAMEVTAPAVEAAPAWSPDGQWIAYVTWHETEGGHVWKIRPDGSGAQRLTQEAGRYLHPAWSPDGRAIVATLGSGAGAQGEGMGTNAWNDLVTLPAAGGKTQLVVRVTPTGGGYVRSSWRAGDRIYFTEATGGGDSESPRVAFRSVKPDGSDVQSHARFSSISEAVPSPDGKWLAYCEADNLWLVPFPVGGPAEGVVIDSRAAGSGAVKLTQKGGLFPQWTAQGGLGFITGSGLGLWTPATRQVETQALGLRLPRAIPSGSAAFANARIVTMNGGQVVEKGTIVVEKNRIAYVGPVEGAPAAGVTFDLAGKTIIPGLIDIHAHHHGSDRGIIPTKRVESGSYLAYGVTTTFDPSAPSDAVFSTAELVEAGRLLGPRTYSTGNAITMTGNPHFPGLGRTPRAAVKRIDAYPDAENLADAFASYGATGLKQYYQPRRAQHQWLVEAARRNGNLVVTAEGMDLFYNLGMTMDGQTAWEHPIMDMGVFSDVTQFLAQAGVHYNPAVLMSGQGYYMLEYFMAHFKQDEDRKQKNWVRWWDLMRKRNHTLRPLGEYDATMSAAVIKEIVRAGGKVGVGAHGQEEGLGTHWEMQIFALSLTPMETLEAATIGNARYLGLDRDLGSLEVGKVADFIVLNADPLADIKSTLAAAQIVKDGRVFDADTLDQIYPEKRPFGTRPWVQSANVGR